MLKYESMVPKLSEITSSYQSNFGKKDRENPTIQLVTHLMEELGQLASLTHVISHREKNNTLSKTELEGILVNSNEKIILLDSQIEFYLAKLPIFHSQALKESYELYKNNAS